MSYPANATCQIRLVKDDDADSGLVIHEGVEPRCGQPVRPWHGQDARVVPLGQGMVTCGNCARRVT